MHGNLPECHALIILMNPTRVSNNGIKTKSFKENEAKLKMGKTESILLNFLPHFSELLNVGVVTFLLQFYIADYFLFIFTLHRAHIALYRASILPNPRR